VDDANPYGAPDAALVHASAGFDQARLAGRDQRLWAALLDSLLALLLIGPLMFFGGFWSEAMAAAEAGSRLPFGTQLRWGLVGLAVFLLLQGWPLATNAQTWGKRALGIRIEKLDGTRPTLVHLLMRRYLPMQAASMIPFVGRLCTAANVLLIFRSDRRCGHDLIAGTRVVRAR
jgi:uncharacterized RDD family membrane protein YckC